MTEPTSGGHKRNPPLYLTADGIRYRVLDVAMKDGKLVGADPPRAWATGRVFRPETGHRRLYRFPTDSRRSADQRTDEDTLRRQLAAADYLPTMPAGAKEQDPR